MAGKLHSLKKDKLKQEFRSASQVSQVDNLMERFAEAVKNGTHSSEWPSAAYSVSKMGSCSSVFDQFEMALIC